MAKDAKLQDAMIGVAEAGKAYAESIAPVGETGEYSTSFGVSNESGRLHSVGAMLYNDAPHAAAVEYDLTHTLAKTADYLNAGRKSNRKVKYTTKGGKVIWATEAQIRNWTRGSA